MMGNFYEETITKDPRFKTTKRVSDMALLEPVTRRKVQAIIDDAGAHGINLRVFETYRSTQRQALLFQQGVTQLRQVGVHHYGAACDIVFWVSGEPSWKGDFTRWVGHLAKVHGLVWGGDWGHPNRPTSFPDYGHVQRIAVADQARLFRGEWYPPEDYVPPPAV